ncbi:MAG: hypothetical protein JO202_12820 [Ktedonobacteraceae bacterium]|nr:hypothetical protein [Ktedonobacteraceae bacterium]
MLIMLIEALSQLTEREAKTISRGRLLQISVDDRLKRVREEDRHAVRHFLSVVACTARRNGQRNAIQLGSKRSPIPIMEFAEYLDDWLRHNEAGDNNYTPSDIKKFLGTAHETDLITISNYGVLSFRHELIAEYFAAEYLFYIYDEKRNSELFWASLYESEAKAAGMWSEPIALWAGLEENPMEVAKFLIQWVEDHDRQGDESDEICYHALALSLTCMGVKAPDALPSNIQKYLEKFVRGTVERATLAKIFKRCADEGGAEVYEALLPLIDTEGLPDLFLELHELHCESNDAIIPMLLFDYLEKVVKQTAYADQILVGILGELGKSKSSARVRARAQSILSETARPIPLRVAAIHVLALVKDASDVQLLISYLHDSDSEQRIAGAAISALATFGPELALDAVREKERNLHSSAHAQTRLNLLFVLKGFLKTMQFQSSISLQHYRGIISASIEFLSLYDNNTTRQIARDLLDEQVQKGKQHTSIVTHLLLNSIGTPDEEQGKNIQGLLQKNCLAILPDIRDYWIKRSATERARARIIEVLGKVHNSDILDFLLRQLDESAARVQNALSHALSLHRPESINPLLRTILAPETTVNACKVAVNAMKEVGADSVDAICKQLSNIPSYTNTSELGLSSLVELLNYFREEAFILDTTNERVVRALIELLPWLVANTKYVQLAAYVIRVMVSFGNPLAVPPLIKLLARSEATLNEVYKQAIIGLSTLGDNDIAFKCLINALDSTQETLTTARVRQALLEMKPYPYDRLLSTFKDTRDAVVQQVRQVFVTNQHVPQTASFLVGHLLDDDDRDGISWNVEQTIKAMPPSITMPPLVKALNKPGWQVALEPLLLACPEPTIVIPLLVNELGDAQRRGPAGGVLLKFNHQFVLPWLISGLEDLSARQYTRWLITQMVDLPHRHNIDLLPHIVGLFNPTTAHPQRSSIPLEVRMALRELLTHELANVSLPALINALRDPALMEDCKLSLVALVNVSGRPGDVVQAILQALRDPYKRRGAHNTLVTCGRLAAEQVCGLLRDSDSAIAEEACSILAEMGEVAFPVIHNLAHDSQRLSDAKNIFMRMSSSTAAKGLLSFLASNDIQEMEMGFYLLYMSIDTEYRSGKINITRAMLQQAQKQPSDVRLRVITALLFFNNNTQTQQRKKIAEHIIDAIKSSPEYHVEFMRALLLLGKQAEEPLANVIDAIKVSSEVQLDAIGTLSTLVDHRRITGYVKELTAIDGMRTRDLRQQELGLRALGGLLASGIYTREELIQLQNNSKRNGDQASFEFYDVLLGTRNMPKIKTLEDRLQRQDSTIKQLREQVQREQNKAYAAEQRASAAESRADDAERREYAANHRANAAEQRANRLQVENNALQSRQH